MCSTHLETAVRTALIRSSHPSAPTEFQEAIASGQVRESIRVGTCPLWTSDSPTTLTCLLICRRAWPASTGCPSTGFSPPTCSRRGRPHWSAAAFDARLPMPLMEKRAVHIHASIKVSIRFIVAHGTHEELSPPGFDAQAAVEGEPLPPGSAARAILARSVGIDLNRTDPRSPGFLSRMLIDLAAQLVRLFAVHAPRFAFPMGFDLAQARHPSNTQPGYFAHTCAMRRATWCAASVFILRTCCHNC